VTGAATSGTVPPGPPDRGAPVGTVLILRALGLGDLLTGVPALRALRRGLPRHRLALAAPAVLAPLVRASGAVDELFVTATHVRSPMERMDWPGRPPELLVNLHGRGPQSHAALLRLAGGGRLLAFACPPIFSDGPRWIRDEHEVARGALLLSWYGVPARSVDLLLAPPPPLPDLTGVVVLHPGASSAERHWPVERYAAVARALRADGYRVVVTGSAAELPLAGAVARGADLPPGAVLAGRTDLATLAALVAHAALVLCPDTGVGHLASAYRTPSVLLFGPVAPRHWGPPAGGPHTALYTGGGDLAGIGTPEVLVAVRDRLAGARS